MLDGVDFDAGGLQCHGNDVRVMGMHYERIQSRDMMNKMYSHGITGYKTGKPDANGKLRST